MPLFIVLFFLLASCNPANNSDEAPLKSSEVVCEPRTSNPLRKPGSGFVFDTNEHTKTIPAEADVLQISITWFDVEPQQGVYDWNTPKIKHVLDAAVKCDRKVGLRIASSWSGYSIPIPKWLVDAGVPLFAPDSTWASEADGRNLFEPAWWNQTYIAAYRQFVKAYGERFNGDPLIEWIDMRYYGFWGEGHRWGSREPWPPHVNKRNLLMSFIDMYFDAFPSTPLLVNLASDQHELYPTGTAIDYALSRGAWIRRDGFGAYLSNDESQLMRRYPQRPIIAEPGRAYKEYLNNSVSGFSVDALFKEMFAHSVSSISMGWGEDDWLSLKNSRPDLVQLAQAHLRSTR